MNLTQDAEPVVIPTEVTPNHPPASTPRDAITKSIVDAKMPVATKKFAAKLLARNQSHGTRFVVTFSVLRGLCHAATNLDVIKHLRRMRAAGLVDYVIFFGPQKVELWFVVKGE